MSKSDAFQPVSTANWFNAALCTGTYWFCTALILCALFAGCGHSARGPAVQFTQVPPAGEGGPDKLENIEGRVRGATPGQRIVVYAKAGSVWWVQPLASQPVTAISASNSFKTPTHLGSQYAALLIDPAYEPASTMKTLPPLGDGIAAIATQAVGPAPAAASQTLKFSGYQWYIRHITSDRNGAISYYDPSNAWTSADGALHLRISRDGDHWKCSQVTLSNHFGYGTYRFTVKEAHLQPAATLTMFTYDDLAQENHREMDIEMSQWGDPKSKNGDYVVQPYNFPENKVIFQAPSGTLTQVLHWEPGRATFQTLKGQSGENESAVVNKNIFTTGIPTPGGETAVIDFCDFKYSRVPLQQGQEVIIERFQYLP